MKTNNSLRSLLGAACMAMMFTACSKEELATPSTAARTEDQEVSILTDDHKESRTRPTELHYKAVSIHYTSTDEEKGGRVKFIRKPVKIVDAEPVCMRCDLGGDGTTIDLNDMGVK